MGQALRKRRLANWPVAVLAVLAAYRAFRSVFRFVSDNISGNVCVVCTHTAFFLAKKPKALRDFHIIFQIVFASFVPGLTARKCIEWCLPVS